MSARRAFIDSQANLDPSKLVFIDESGVNPGMALNHGWAQRGTKPVVERRTRAKNVTLIGAIALNGTRVLTRIEENLNGGVIATLG